jgi:hypothetical protein
MYHLNAFENTFAYVKATQPITFICDGAMRKVPTKEHADHQRE